MRSFAITYPQLMNQALGAGLAPDELVRLARAHELAQGLYDGLYRKHRVPFLCHGIRTASIALAESRSLEVVIASMLHAVYFLHVFAGSDRRGPRSSDRTFLRERIGEAAEMRVARYGELPWDEPEALRGYVRDASRHPPLTRDLLWMKLANELEDHLDAAAAYTAPQGLPGARVPFAADYVALAEALGHHELAGELQQALERCGATDVPPALRSRHRGSYRAARLWRASPFERLGSALRRRGLTGWMR